MFEHRQLKRRNQSVQRSKEEEEIDMHSGPPSGARLSGDGRGLISARRVPETNDANGSVANALGREEAMRSGSGQCP